MHTYFKHIFFRVVLYTLFVFTLVFVTPGLHAASAKSTFPVQVSPMLIPPYSLYLSDYFTGTAEKLSLTLTNRDLQQPQVRVRLRLTISCASGLILTTHTENYFEPIVLDAGVPTRLTMQELAPYFLPKNLITQGFMQGGKLSEGNVEFAFEVLEYNTGKVISQKNIAFANITSPKPPILNLPVNNDILVAKDPQNIVFQWSPQYMAFANPVEYEFILKELVDKNVSAQQAFAYSREVYRATVTGTSLNYTMSQPILQGSKRYAWCVRAVMHEGVEAANRFENDGYSPVSSFNMRVDCHAPVDVKASTERGNVLLQWTPQPNDLNYIINYRSTDSGSDTWAIKSASGSSINLTDLTPGHTYNYRVGTYCDDNLPVYSATGSIAVPAEDIEFLANCGKDPQITITNRKPKDRLKPLDVIMAGDFPVVLTAVNGSGGTFSGTGWVKIPYLGARFAVKFNSINVSEENRLIGGVIETAYDKTETGVGNLDALDQGGTDGNIKTGISRPNVKVDFSVPETLTVQYNEAVGSLAFVDATGASAGSITVPKNDAGKPVFPVTVEDKDGNVYEVHENPEKSTTTTQPYVAVKLGKQEGEIPSGTLNFNAQDVAEATVTFDNSTDSRYALDTWQDYYSSVSIIMNASNDVTNNFKGGKYEKIGEDYWVKWKYIPPGKTDKVTAELLIKNEAKIDPAKVVFKTKAGKVFESTYNATTHKFTITLLGGEDKDGQELYAIHPATTPGNWWNLGKLDIMSYTPVERKVVLVKTQANDNTDAATVQTELNRIYNPVGISWSVSSEQFIYNTDNIFEGKSGIISTYLPNMRTLNAAYQAAKSSALESKTAYLFLVNQAAGGDRDKQGFMPRGMQFGYINTSTANVGGVIAHELGHGSFKLYHTFNSGYGSTAVGTQGTTENLMDYKGGTNLAKWQWDQMYDPAIINGVFDGDKEAMLIKSVWLTPDWKPFKYDLSDKISVEKTTVNGTVGAILEVKDGKYTDRLFVYNPQTKKYEYKISDNETDKLPIDEINDLSPNTIVYVLDKNAGKCGKYYSTNWGYVEDKQGKIDYSDTKNIHYKGDIACSGGKFSSQQEEDEAYAFWQFLKNCYDSYKTQKEGYVPRCLWDHNLYIPNGPFGYYINDPAFTSGIVDGLIETADGVLDIAKFLDCYNPVSFRAWTDGCVDTRDKTYNALKQMYLVISDKDKLNEAYNAVKGKLGEYIDETTAVDNQARYNHGKIVFNVASLFIGVGEAKALLNGEKTLALVLKEGLSAYATIPETILKLTQKAGREGIAYIALKTGNKGAYLGYKLANTEIKLADVTAQQVFANIEWATKNGVVLEKIENITFVEKAGTQKTGILEIVKQEDGKLGVRVIDDMVIPSKYRISIFDKVKIIAKDETLPTQVIESFLDNYYYTGETLEDISVYRRFGGDGANQAKLFSGFSSTEAVLSRNDLAILKKWSNMQFEAEFVVEKGATLNLGKIAPQSIYSGGADQVLLPRNIPENWVKNIKDLKTGKTYSLEEFKTAFPELIYKK